MPNHLRLVRNEFAASGGTVYAVERTTGEIKKITTPVYVACQAAGLLDAYEIKLTVADARAEQWRILARLATAN